MIKFSQENPFLPNPNMIKELIEQQANNQLGEYDIVQKKIKIKNQQITKQMRRKGARYDG